MELAQIFATRASRMAASEIRELLKLLDRPEIISFAGGIPDPALFPHEAFSAAYAELLTPAQQAKALQYSTSEGFAPLRDWIAARMGRLGIPCTAENILITSGSQQALDYIGKLFLTAGDTAMVGWPTYLGALGAFNAYEPRYARLDPLANSLPQTESAVKFAYCSVDFANPTGRTLSLAEREALLAQAEQLGCAIVEDAAYQELRYDGEVIPPILALELQARGDINACRTLYCGSFSKTLTPGLRVGWVCASAEAIQQMVLIKQASDLHSPTINQMAIHHVASRIFDAHVTKIRDSYRAHRDVMLKALDAHMPEGVSWTKPEGGMFVWLTLPEDMDGAALLAHALQAENVAFVPGGAFFPDGSGANHLRLAFSNNDAPQIEDGIARLGRAISCYRR